jgi:regulatory LuxR family protein
VSVALDGSGRAGRSDIWVSRSESLRFSDLRGEDLTNGEIAERLFISVKTAGHHVSNVLMKLHPKSRTEAAVYGLRRADKIHIG